jgi:hypothetical protein
MTELDISFAKVVEEHRELRQMARDLSRSLEGPQPEITDEGSHTWAANLAQQLVKLHHKLVLHMQEEERLGFLEDVAEQFPRAIRTTTILQDDHNLFLLEATMLYAEGTLPSDPDLCGRTLSLLNRLETHRQTETELLMRLCCEDLGLGD